MTPDIRLAGYHIAEHKDAPLMSGADGPLVLKHIFSELASDNPQVNETTVDVIRQAGLVNLYFFLRYIAAYRGPYEKLNTLLHLEVCNFYQRSLLGGTKQAICLPRSSYKSTICTHGGITWQLVRNPNLRVGILAANADRGNEFFGHVKRNFENNDFITGLYPHTKPNKDVVWNAESITLPGRTRDYVEPSLKFLSIDSSTAGNHFDLLAGDDIVGDAHLNADRSTTTDMERAKGKFKSSTKTLIVEWARSAITLAFTRYAQNDAYDYIMDGPKVVFGWPENAGPLNPRGEWEVYTRSVMQDGKSIDETLWPNEQLEEMRENDSWTFWTQYMNNPGLGGMGDLSQYRVKPADVLWDSGKWWVDFRDGVGPVSIVGMSVLGSADPAGSERKGSVKTSKQAIAVHAMDAKGRIVLLDKWTAHAPVTKLFDKMFEYNKLWKFRVMVCEMQGPFKMAKSLLDREKMLRGENLNVIGIDALGDKLDTTRTILQPVLERGMYYCNVIHLNDVEHAIRNFPTGNMDLLDTIKIGIHRLRRPETDEDAEYGGRPPYRVLHGVDPMTGM